MRIHATMACPLCGTLQYATMPEDTTVTRYECEGCRRELAPRAGDDCVFCSYADTECPPRQRQSITV